MRVRSAALLAAIILVSSACGARLTQQQREFGIRAESATQGSPGATVPGSSTGTGSGRSLSGTHGTTSGKGKAARAGTGGTIGATGGGGGGQVSGTQSGGAGTGSAQQAKSNGGSTDTGVTATTINLATIYDGTGPEPGIFDSAKQAMNALAAYVNSQGGIYGRDLQIDALDDQTNTGGNRAATEQACQKDFAIVGSMSAFDDGGPPIVQQCKIPDVPAIPVTPQHELEKGVHPSYPNRPDYFIVGYPDYIKQHYPDVIQHAGILWLNASAASSNAKARMRAYQHVGFKWVYQQQVQVTEPNYAPYVAAMRQAGVKYVTMVGDYQSIARLNEAMQQQSWFPEVRDWDSVVYDQGFLQLAGPSANGSLFYMDTSMVEEAAHNPEMQLYLYWLNKTCPNCHPTYFGEYAWSAGRLFVKAAAAAGPHLTRAALDQQLSSIHSWTDYGMHAAQDPGSDLPSPCIFYGKIENGKFVRVFPSSGFSCSEGGLLHQSVS
jgi:ABC-type branched-subunit amino acid transport system substrate-binding protein